MYLHNRSQGPLETYLKSCSCANFRFNLRVQNWNSICLSIYPLARLAFCQTDVCHMQVISQPPCSTSLHALCTHSDPSANVKREEEVFLTVCILFATILLRGINVFSCPQPYLQGNKAKQTKNPPLPKQLNTRNPAAGKGREGVERKGQRGWITLKLFLSCSSGWAETAKYRIYQSRWTRKMTWTTCFKEQEINEVHFLPPGPISSPKTPFSLHERDLIEQIFNSLQPSLWTCDNVNVKQIGFLSLTCLYYI